MACENKMMEPDAVLMEPKSLPTLTLYNRKWCYKGEGNANIVMAVPEDSIVVRVIKGDEMTVAETAKTLTVRLNYCDAIQRLFFAGCDYVDIPELMSMSTEELHNIDRCLQQCRPISRMHKSLGWASGLVSVCSDYTVLPRGSITQRPVFCAEIKPKQGWLHEADIIQLTCKRNYNTFTKCVFCANQYLKLCRKDVYEISQYCPLDMFSGHRERVERAVHKLLKTPQNNLKIFCDGILMDNSNNYENITHLPFINNDRFVKFIAAALLDNFDRCEEFALGMNVKSKLVDDDNKGCDFNSTLMSQQCVLHKILTMQKMQTTGFETVCSEYKQLPESSAIQPFGHVDRLMNIKGTDEIFLSPVDGYLVATTARDCSVFVTFCQTNNDDCTKQHVQFDDHHYTVQVKVSDLDPKPLLTINKHQKRNANILQACDQVLNQQQE